MHGEHHLQGFRNGDILQILYPRTPKDSKQRKRLSARVRRKLLLLRGHHLIKRVGRSHRYRVTEHGLRVMAAAMFYTKETFEQKLIELAA
jgi:hypothetical protein